MLGKRAENSPTNPYTGIDLCKRKMENPL